MSPIRRGILTGVLAGIVIGVAFLITPNIVVTHLGNTLYSPWFPAVLIGLYLVRPILAWPITALSVLVGFRYGIVIGLPVALIGAVGTSLLPYLAARYVRTETGWLGWIAGGSERFFTVTGNLRGVIAARLAPTPAEAISVAAGAGRVPLGAFVLGTLIGELPWTIAAVLAGHSMRRLSLTGVTPDPWIVLSGILIAVLVLAKPTYRYARDRHKPTE